MDREDRSENCELSPADAKISEEGGEGSAPDARAVISLQAVVKAMVKQLCPAVHGGPQGCRDSPADHGGAPHFLEVLHSVKRDPHRSSL